MNSWHSHDPEPFVEDEPITQVSMTRVTITRKREEPDKRYRILVLLQRSDRPTYWTFKCPHCGYDVQELQNIEVEAMSDLAGVGTSNDMLVGRRCGGPYCKYWYYFKLNGISR